MGSKLDFIPFIYNSAHFVFLWREGVEISKLQIQSYGPKIDYKWSQDDVEVRRDYER